MTFVNLNIAAFDAGKRPASAWSPTRQAGLEALTEAMAGYRTDEAYRARIDSANADWRQVVEQAYHLGHQPLPQPRPRSSARSTSSWTSGTW